MWRWLWVAFFVQEGAKEVVGGDIDRETIGQTSYYTEKGVALYDD